MIIDSSAVIAILHDEPDRPVFAAAAARAETCIISAPTLLESMIVAERRGAELLRKPLDEIIRELVTEVAPFTAEHAAIAREAHQKYGKGSGHRAQLNFGDCISYALAKESGEALLFKGDDFTHTDVVSAMP